MYNIKIKLINTNGLQDKMMIEEIKDKHPPERLKG